MNVTALPIYSDNGRHVTAAAPGGQGGGAARVPAEAACLFQGAGMSPSGVRRISIATALLCLGAGLSTIAAGTASAATQGSTIAVRPASALTRAAASTLTLYNPGTWHSEPNVAAKPLAIKYADSASTPVTQDFSATGLPPGLAIGTSTGATS